jgi:hypothetical protein
VGWAAALILLLGVAAYANSLSGAFVFDDLPTIVDNPTIRHLWPLGPVFHPPAATTATGRPLLNLSFALNYAIGGTEVRGYHVLNVSIHLLAGLTLFGCIRRTLRRMGSAGWATADPTWLALAAAGIWVVHPLATESVDYVVQRAESLMGLLYLFTLYAFIRSVDGKPGREAVLWRSASVLACAAGMAVKEVMVTAPVMILLYDRMFAAGTFRAAWRQRRLFYLGLAASWIPFGWLLATARFGTGYALLAAVGNSRAPGGPGIVGAAWSHATTQCIALPRYLGLSVWPHPLIFEYGPTAPPAAAAAVAGGICVGLLVSSTLWATWRRRAAGFLGCWFFVILAPTSSFVPGDAQPIVEHRMYLPLAAVIVLGVAGWFRLTHRLGGRSATVDTVPATAGRKDRRAPVGFALTILGLAACLAGLTARRNADYRSEISLWRDTVAKRPMNPVAHDNLGASLLRAGRWAEATAEFRQALSLRSYDPEANNALGNLMIRTGRRTEAIAYFQEAVRLAPAYADARFNLGLALIQSDRLAAAAEQFEAVVRLQPGDAKAREVLTQLRAALAGAPVPPHER